MQRKMLTKFYTISALLPLSVAIAGGQARTTDGRRFDVSAFAGAYEARLGLGAERNFGLTTGLDVKFMDYRGFGYAFEERSTLPTSAGTVAGEKSALGGLRTERTVGPILLFGDVLGGHGSLTYQGGGYYVPSDRYLYYVTDSIVLSAGGGIEVHIKKAISLRLDAQIQHWNTPVAAGGSIISVPAVMALVYHLPSHTHKYK